MGGFQRKTLFGVLFLAAVFALAALLFYLEKPTGSLIGVVKTEDGRVLPMAKIQLEDWPRSRKGVSDSQGDFRFEQVPVGKYYLNISARGYQTSYLPKEQEILEGQVMNLGVITLKELEPNLNVSVWSTTKTPDEKITLSISGAKVRDIHFAAYRLDLIQYLTNGGKFEDLEKAEFDPKGRAGIVVAREWDAVVPDEEVPQFDRKEKADLNDPALYLIHSIASSLDRQKVFTSNLLVNKTDLGFVAKKDENRILIYASTFLKPTPVNGAKVVLISNEGPKHEGATNPQGVAEFALASLPKTPDNKWMVVVTNGTSTSFSWTPTYYSYEDETGEGGTEGEGEGEVEGVGEEEAETQPLAHRKYRAFLYTERPIYRPGQKVYFKGIVRNENAQGTYDTLPPIDVPVVINNVRGDTIYETTLKTSAFGSFWGEIDLEEEADLGLYSVVATLGGKEFRRDFDVDEYRKPEFKVEIKPDKVRYFSGEKINFLVDTQYYSGAPVEAELTYTVYKSSYDSAFLGEDRPSYLMNEEEYAGGYGEVVEEGTAKSDAQGHAVVVVTSAKAEEDYRYTLRVTAKDITERTVTTENDALVTAGDFFFKTERTVFLATPKNPFPLTVLTRSYDDQPVARDFRIEVERQKWDPIASEYDYKKVSSVDGKTGADGRGKSDVTVEQGGYYRLAITGKDPAGRKVLFYDYLWVSGTTADEEDYGLQQNLTVIADKKKYEAGEIAKLLIVAPVKDVSVLISIEGSKIHEYRVEKLEGFSKEIQVPLKTEWIPTAYVTVSAVGKKEYYEESAKIAISPKEHYLTVEIQPNAEKYHPADTATYKVITKDNAGKPIPAEVSLGVVDESLYALRKDSTDIKDYFWGPRPNRVATNYSFSGYFSGGIEKEDKNLLRRNFKDTAFWNPSIVTNDQGEATVSLKMPDNLTTWRATVVAQTLSTSVGQQINKVISSKDLIVRVATPRFFMERDRVTLKAIVSNYTNKDQTLKIKLGLEGGIAFADPAQAQDREMIVGPQKTVSFDFVVLPKLMGDAKVQLLAKNAEISDGVELKIPVLPHGLEDHHYAQGDVLGGVAGTPSKGNVPIALPPQTDPNRTRLKVTLDTTFVAQLLGSLTYLVDYPYGCVEQTTSRMLPALMVSHLYKTLGISDSSLEKKIPKVIEKSIRRLEKFQHSDGGWGWWKEDKTDSFMTSYALYALLKAQQMGQKVTEYTITRGKESLTNQLKNGITGYFSNASYQDETLYFVYYVASLAGIPNNPPMPGDRPISTPMAQALLILSLEAQGKHAAAAPILADLERKAICQGGLCRYSDDKKTYRGDAEVTSWALQAIMRGHSENQILKDSIVKWLLKDRKGGIWRHTRETASVLYALSEYAQALPGSQEGVKANLGLNGQELEKVNVASPHFVRKLPSCASRPIAVGETAESRPALRCVSLKDGQNNLSIENLLATTLYYQSDLTFFSQGEDLAPTDHGIRVKREYVRLTRGGSDINGEPQFKASELKGKIRKGEIIGVKLTVESSEDLSYLVIEDPLPSGFEVIKDLRFDPKAEYFADTAVRDEKIALFVDYLKTGTHIFVYGLRPELAGLFHAMPTDSFEMYRPEWRGLGGEMKLEVE